MNKQPSRAANCAPSLLCNTVRVTRNHAAIDTTARYPPAVAGSALMPRGHLLCLAAKEAKGPKRETFSIVFPRENCCAIISGTPFQELAVGQLYDQGVSPLDPHTLIEARRKRRA